MAGMLWLLIAVEALVFAYAMNMTAATLAFGRELASSDTGTGYQSAITPPWQTGLTLTLFAAVPITLGLMWYRSGIGTALLAVVCFVIGAGVGRALLPPQSGVHYRNRILHSMVSRYAAFVRSGDTVRADAMRLLLASADMDPAMLDERRAPRHDAT